MKFQGNFLANKKISNEIFVAARANSFRTLAGMERNVYKRYYSPFEEIPQRRHIQEPVIIQPQKIENEVCEEVKKHKRHSSSPFDFLGRMKSDDLILIGIIVILLMEDKENRDIPLILSLGFLFLIEYIEGD